MADNTPPDPVTGSDPRRIDVMDTDSSTFTHEVTQAQAQAQAQRVRRDAIRAAGERIVAYLAEHAEARDELEELGTPQSDLP